MRLGRKGEIEVRREGNGGGGAGRKGERRGRRKGGRQRIQVKKVGGRD